MIRLLIILFASVVAYAGTDFRLDEVIVECKASMACEQKTIRFKSMEGEYRGLVHLKETLKVLASDGGYQFFSYKLEQIENRHILTIHFDLKPVIDEVNIRFLDRDVEYDPILLTPLREGDFFEPQKFTDSSEVLRSKLDSLGFPNNSHTAKIIEASGKVRIDLAITLGTPRIFKTVDIETSSQFVKNFLKRKFLSLYNKPFDLNSFKIYLDQAQKELFSYGYYLIALDFTPTYKKNRVILKIKVTSDQLFAFDFKNLQREHRDVIHNLVIDLFRKYKRPLNEQTLKSALKEHYQKKALLNVKIAIERSEFRNTMNEQVQLYRIRLEENGKTRLTGVNFRGNSFFTNSKLDRMFNKEAFELASIRYYDQEYFTYFQDFLKNKYIEKGFVQVRVYDPVIIFDKFKKTSKVEYTIQEGQRTIIKKITFSGLPEGLEEGVLKAISNKSGNPFNPIKMTDDIKALGLNLQEQGYYYAEVTNANELDLVKYNRTGSEVSLHFRIDPGPLVKLNRVLYLGNDKTRRKVLAKKVNIDSGGIITPSKTREIESAISATGLFNTVNVTPLKHNAKNGATDLLIRVTERDYGLIELAPGYRTDLGIKLTGTITYQNIGGYNRSISLRSQLNRRTSFTTVDPERRNQIGHILEHNTSLTYNQGDIFDTLIDGAASAAYQTRRFYSFDANILRLNGTLSRDLSKKLSTSVRYQFEDIAQYSATEEINNGSFKIGSVTPSLSYDLRNNQVNATSGAFLNLSCEFANPYLLSQKESDLTINYFKLISRNRFYIPFKNGTVALSMVGGIQENLSKDKITVSGVEQAAGYIPTIKVFRLTGMDIVRGYTDEEMNRLVSGEDVSDVRVTNKAYMANLKLEPRYFLNDALMAGVFYDAGRVFVGKMNLGELRESVGVTFKVITPVGTLDFDYGIKLLRKKDPSGRLEDPGRFHVSIGFF